MADYEVLRVSDIVKRLVLAAGHPSQMAYYDNGGFMVEFDNDRFAAHIALTPDRKGEWKTRAGLTLRDKKRTPKEVPELIEEAKA